MNLDEVKANIEARLPRLQAALIAEQNRLGIKHAESNGLDKLQVVMSNTNPFVFRIRIRFKRSGVFVHKGVGRHKKTGEPSTRQPKPWFNPVVEKFIQEVSEEVLDDFTKIVFSDLNIR